MTGGGAGRPRTRWLVRPGGVRLAWELHGRGRRRLAVVTHGIFGYRDMAELEVLREALDREGWDCVVWDVRGHGDSGGRFSFGREEWADLQALVHTVRDLHPAEELAAIGFSFGAFHSLVAAANGTPFDRLVLVAGPKDFRGLSRAMFGGHFFATMRHRMQRPLRRTRLGAPWGPRTMPVSVIDQLEVPMLFVHGTRDWIVPAAHSEALHEQAPGGTRLEILDGGLHAEYLLKQMPERFLGTVLPWLERPEGEGETR